MINNWTCECGNTQPLSCGHCTKCGRPIPQSILDTVIKEETKVYKKANNKGRITAFSIIAIFCLVIICFFALPSNILGGRLSEVRQEFLIPIENTFKNMGKDSVNFPQYEVIKDDTLNVRREADKNSELLGELNPGETVTGTGNISENEKWTEIFFPDDSSTGWTRSAYLKMTSEGSVSD